MTQAGVNEARNQKMKCESESAKMEVRIENRARDVLVQVDGEELQNAGFSLVCFLVCHGSKNSS